MNQPGKITPAYLWLAAFVAIAVIVFAVTKALSPVENQMPEAEGQAVWDYIMEENSYTDWEQWPGMEGMLEGESPHGAYLKLYVNGVAMTAINDNVETMPEHALIVKENYNKNEELVALTPMYKVDGYNPDGGNWFWAKYGMDGEIQAEGKIGSCIDCHAKADTDYLFSMSE